MDRDQGVEPSQRKVIAETAAMRSSLLSAELGNRIARELVPRLRACNGTPCFQRFRVGSNP